MSVGSVSSITPIQQPQPNAATVEAAPAPQQVTEAQEPAAISAIAAERIQATPVVAVAATPAPQQVQIVTLARVPDELEAIDAEHETDRDYMVRFLASRGIGMQRREDGSIFLHGGEAIFRFHPPGPAVDAARFGAIQTRLAAAARAMPAPDAPMEASVAARVQVIRDRLAQLQQLLRPDIQETATIIHHLGYEFYLSSLPYRPSNQTVAQLTEGAIAVTGPLDAQHDADVACMVRLLTAAGMNVHQAADGSFNISPNINDHVTAARQEDLNRYDLEMTQRLRELIRYIPEEVDRGNPQVGRIIRNRNILISLVGAFRRLLLDVVERLRTVSAIAFLESREPELNADIACMQRMISAAGVGVDVETVQRDESGRVRENIFAYEPIAAQEADIARYFRIRHSISISSVDSFNGIDRTNPLFGRINSICERLQSLYDDFRELPPYRKNRVLRKSPICVIL